MRLLIRPDMKADYAKELVLENKTELLKDQQHVIDEQYRRLDRFRDSVDVIVTDSPLLLGQVYGEGNIRAIMICDGLGSWGTIRL